MKFSGTYSEPKLLLQNLATSQRLPKVIHQIILFGGFISKAFLGILSENSKFNHHLGRQIGFCRTNSKYNIKFSRNQNIIATRGQSHQNAFNYLKSRSLCHKSLSNVQYSSKRRYLFCILCTVYDRGTDPIKNGQDMQAGGDVDKKSHQKCNFLEDGKLLSELKQKPCQNVAFALIFMEFPTIGLPVPVWVLSALSRVRLSPQPVHGHGQGLVCLQGYAPEGHGA